MKLILIMIISVTIAILSILFSLSIIIWYNLYDNEKRIITKIPNFVINLYDSRSTMGEIVTAIIIVCFIAFMISASLYNDCKTIIATYDEDQYDIEKIIIDYKEKNRSDPDKYEIESINSKNGKPLVIIYKYDFKEDCYILEVYNVDINLLNMNEELDYSKYKRKD